MTSFAVFDWEAAFEELERRRKKIAEEEGEVYVAPVPPKAKLESISSYGIVEISFTQPMKPFDKLEMIKKQVKLENSSEHLFEVTV